MTSTPSVRGDTETGQPPGLLIAKWGRAEVYGQDDGTLQLWHRSDEMLHLGTMAGSGEIDWTRDGKAHATFEREWWRSKLGPVLAEHKRTQS